MILGDDTAIERDGAEWIVSDATAVRGRVRRHRAVVEDIIGAVGIRIDSRCGAYAATDPTSRVAGDRAIAECGHRGRISGIIGYSATVAAGVIARDGATFDGETCGVKVAEILDAAPVQVRLIAGDCTFSDSECSI